MSAPSTPIGRRGFTALLLLSPLAPTLSACTGDPTGPGRSAPTTGSVDVPSAAGTAALEDAMTAEQEAADLVTAVAARHRSLRKRLRPVSRLHQVRLSVLLDLLGETPTGTATPGVPPAVPARPDGALRVLSRAAARRSGERAERAVALDDSAVARVLASLSASDADLSLALGGTRRIDVSPSTTGLGAAAAAAVALLQAALAGEHAAIYVYGVLGGRISASTAPEAAALLRDGYDIHRERREELRAALRGLDAVPVAPAVAYRVKAPGRATDALLAQARALESRAAASYLALLTGLGPDGPRSWALGALRDAAVRRTALGAAPQAFPGAPDLTGA